MNLQYYIKLILDWEEDASDSSTFFFFVLTPYFEFLREEIKDAYTVEEENTTHFFTLVKVTRKQITI